MVDWFSADINPSTSLTTHFAHYTLTLPVLHNGRNKKIIRKPATFHYLFVFHYYELYITNYQDQTKIFGSNLGKNPYSTTCYNIILLNEQPRFPSHYCSLQSSFTLEVFYYLYCLVLRMPSVFRRRHPGRKLTRVTIKLAINNETEELDSFIWSLTWYERIKPLQ